MALMFVSIPSTVTPSFRSLVLARSHAIDESNAAASHRAGEEVRTHTQRVAHPDFRAIGDAGAQGVKIPSRKIGFRPAT
jgi:hypothetical protein